MIEYQTGLDHTVMLGSKFELKFPQIEILLYRILIKTPLETIDSCKDQLFYIPERIYIKDIYKGYISRIRFISN